MIETKIILKCQLAYSVNLKQLKFKHCKFYFELKFTNYKLKF